jgi:hypothetical protein
MAVSLMVVDETVFVVLSSVVQYWRDVVYVSSNVIW